MEKLAVYSHNINTDNIIDIVSQYYYKVEYDEIDDENCILSIILEKKMFSVIRSIHIKIHKRIIPDYKLYKNDDPLVERLLHLRSIAEQIKVQQEETSKIKDKLIAKINTINTEIIFEAKPHFEEEHRSFIMEIVKYMKGFLFTGQNSLYGGTAFWHYDGLCILNEKGHSMLKDYKIVIDNRFKIEDSCSDQQLARKYHSEMIMKKKKIPIQYSLPAIQDDIDTKIRDKSEIIKRTLALFYVGLRGENNSIDNLMEVYNAYNIGDKLTQYEKSTFLSRKVDDEVLLAASWRFESMWTLLWALGYVEELTFPDEICDMNKVEKLIFSMSESEFIENSVIVIRKKILDEADLYYRLYHFIQTIDDLDHSEYSDLISGVISERYYTLLWLIQCRNLEWDELSTCE